jgi:hypothetical protein
MELLVRVLLLTELVEEELVVLSYSMWLLILERSTLTPTEQMVVECMEVEVQTAMVQEEVEVAVYFG